jgi:Mg2+ and Co2+ transporter CorA
MLERRQQGLPASPAAASLALAISASNEQYYTGQEVGKQLAIHPDTVKDLFRNETHVHTDDPERTITFFEFFWRERWERFRRAILALVIGTVASTLFRMASLSFQHNPSLAELYAHCTLTHELVGTSLL